MKQAGHAVRLMAEGHTPNDLKKRRWGIALLIGSDMLFDTFGDPGVILEGLKKLKVDIKKIRHIIISHEHWDHISGLWPILDIAKKARVYLCAGTPESIIKLVKEKGAEPVLTGKNGRLIKKGFMITAPVPGIYKESRMYEQALVIKFPAGNMLLTGCAHPGIEKMVDAGNKAAGNRITSIAGGFHMQGLGTSDIKAVCLGLSGRGVKKALPLHCTGKKASKAMKRTFGIVKGISGPGLAVI